MGTTLIGVTGSAGKTTTKEALGAILVSRGRSYRTLGNQNGGFQVAMNLLRVRPWYRFAVLEIGIAEPGSMRRLARMEPVRPTSGATLIRDDPSASIDTFHASLHFLEDARAGRPALVLSDFSDGGMNFRNRAKLLSEATGLRLCGKRPILSGTMWERATRYC